MRVLHLDSGRFFRGGQHQVLRLIEGLRAEGIESTLLAREDSPLYLAACERGWKVEPLSLLRTLALARRHDLVHAHDARTHTFGAFIRSIPVVVSRRVAFAVRSRWKYQRARRYLAVSGFVKSVLIAGGVPANKIDVVYDGVPLLPQSSGTRIVAPADFDDPMKGAPLAMEAARLAGVELLVSSNLERDLADASMLVYISHSEGLGSAALFAMAAGVPVIASHVGGLPEAVLDRETGLLVENHPQAIAAAIRELTGDPALARRLGRNARQAVAERFTVEHMVRRTMEVYRTVLS